MQKALWALALLAALALGSSIVTAVLDGTAQARDARQIAVLQRAQSVDQKEISGLRADLHHTKGH